MFDGFALEAVELPEASLRVRHGGSGPPVLLLHGHPRTHATWHRVAPLLAGSHAVVCPDLRGHDRGATSRSALPWTIRRGRPPGGAGRGADRRGAGALRRPFRRCLVALVLLRATGQAGAGDPRRPGRLVRQRGGADGARRRTRTTGPPSTTRRRSTPCWRTTAPGSASTGRTTRKTGARAAGRLPDAAPVGAAGRPGGPVRRPAGGLARLGARPGGRGLDCGHHMAEEAPEELAGELLAFLGR